METVDPETGEVRTAATEIVPVAPLAIRNEELMAAAAIVRRIADLDTPLDAIPVDLLAVNELGRRVRQFVADCNAAALARMQAANATEVAGGGVRMKVRQDHKYRYTPALNELAELVGVPGGITEDEVLGALRQKLDPDKRVLNAIVKRGGAPRRIIEAATTDEGGPKLDVEKVS